MGLAGMAGGSAALQGEVLYAREDTDVLNQPGPTAAVNGRLRKGTAVAVQQMSGASWVRIAPDAKAQQRWVKRDALQSMP
jgi:hypothetical protein